MSRKVNIFGGVINPLALAPVLWVDFTDASTMSIVSGGVDSIVGKGSLGLTFTPFAPTARPTLVTSAINGLSAAQFDGSSNQMTCGSSNMLRNVSGATVYIIRKWAISPVAGRIMFKVATPSAAGRLQMQGGSVANKNSTGGRTLDADSFVRVDSSANVSVGTYQIQSAVLDYANTDLYQYIGRALDGSTTSYQSATTTSNTASPAVTIGSGDGTAYFQGEVAEVLAFHTAHDAATRAAMWGYFKFKYGI